MIGLWRNKPPTAPAQSSHIKIPIEVIFPSGRQALTEAIRQMGLTRNSRIALPEWSSLCVIGAVGRVATPIPMTEVVEHNIGVDAVLLYEQWGWTLASELKSPIAERFKNAVIILDRVDSADIKNSNRIKFYPQNNQIDLISLSKMLGLDGGGIVKINGQYLQFWYKSPDNHLSDYLWRDSQDNAIREKLLHIHKNDVESIHKGLKRWLENNDLTDALKHEALKRRENLGSLLNSPFSDNWPDWMHKAFEQGACPGIVPLFRNADVSILNSKKMFLEKHYDIETQIYHFNWSGNPLEPDYQLCLAFPMHGLISEPKSIIEDIKN